MENTENDYEKHVEALSAHLQTVVGPDWQDMTPIETIKLLARTMHGLNAKGDDMVDYATVMNVSPHNVVNVGAGTYQVLSMVEFQTEEVVQ